MTYSRSLLGVNEHRRTSLSAILSATFTAKLADNKTLFCHFSGKTLNNTSEQSEESHTPPLFSRSFTAFRMTYSLVTFIFHLCSLFCPVQWFSYSLFATSVTICPSNRQIVRDAYCASCCECVTMMMVVPSRLSSWRRSITS